MTRRMMVILAVFAGTMALSGTALAGGWATTTIDEAPDEFRAGVTYEITYTVLQHGVTPVDGSTAILFRPAKGTTSSASEINFKGFPTGEPGQYRANVELPASGVWIWEVEQGVFGTFELGSVNVSESGASGFLADGGAWLLAGAVVAVGLAWAATRFRHVLSRSSAPASRITSRT